MHDALQKMSGAHDMLLDLTEAITGEDPFATLRLLQTCGISKFGHVPSDVPPALAQDFAREKDEATIATFATIQQSPTPENSTHALPVGAREAGLTSLEAHAAGGYIGAFFRIAGPLQQWLTSMGGTTNREIVAALHDPSASKNARQWARSVCEAHDEASLLQQSFTPAERHIAGALAPRGNTIYSAGDPSSTVEDLPITIDDEELPELHASTTTPKGVRYIAARVRKMMDWRKFFTLLGTSLNC
jgi:hypothetical protein